MFSSAELLLLGPLIESTRMTAPTYYLVFHGSNSTGLGSKSLFAPAYFFTLSSSLSNSTGSIWTPWIPGTTRSTGRKCKVQLLLVFILLQYTFIVTNASLCNIHILLNQDFTNPDKVWNLGPKKQLLLLQWKLDTTGNLGTETFCLLYQTFCYISCH